MLIFLTLLVPLLAGAAMAFIRFPSGKVRAIYVESAVCLTSLMVLSLLLTRTEETLVLYHLIDKLPLAFRLDGPACVFAGLVAVIVLTWGSIASFAIVLGLVISGSMMLLRKAMENRDENDYYTDDN